MAVIPIQKSFYCLLLVCVATCNLMPTFKQQLLSSERQCRKLVQVERQYFSACASVHIGQDLGSACIPSDGQHVLMQICDTKDASDSCSDMKSLQKPILAGCFYYVIWGTSKWAAKVIQRGLERDVMKTDNVFIIIDQNGSFQTNSYNSIFYRSPFTIFVNPSTLPQKYVFSTFTMKGELTKLFVTDSMLFKDFHIQQVYKKIRDFQGRTVKAVIADQVVPTIYKKTQEPISKQDMQSLNMSEWDGYELKLLQIISKASNFNLSFFVVEDRSWGKKVNGSWNGMVNAVYQGRADVAMGLITISKAREEVIDFAFVLNTDNANIFSPVPPFLAQWKTVVLPFTFLVWVLLICAMFLGFISLWGVAHASYDLRIEGDFFTKLSQACMFCVRAACSETNLRLPESTPSRAVGISVLLFGMFMAQMYAAVLTSFLTSPPRQKPIVTFNDLFASEAKWGIWDPGSIYEELYTGSINPQLVQLWKGMQFQPTSQKCIERVMTHQFVCIEQNIIARVIEAQKGYDKDPKWIYGKERFLEQHFSYMLQHHSSLKLRFDDLILLLHANGLINKEVSDHFGIMRSPGSFPKSDRTDVVLSLKHVQGAFLFLVIGYTTALLGLAVEIVLKRLS